MRKKTAGRLNPPPPQAEFDKIPLAHLCRHVTGAFFRLHSIDRATGSQWPPLHFSRRGNCRFDPKGGVGALCVAETLEGALLELFDDHWGPVGSLGRSITEQTLRETWVSLVSLPEVDLFDATGVNLSKAGTDAQLLTGKYSTTRNWASRIMHHPDQIDGILYRSRHDLNRLNVALFKRDSFLPALLDPDLDQIGADKWKRKPTHRGSLVHGPAIVLRDHSRLQSSLVGLQVARLP